MSPRTLEAYGGDLARFSAFLDSAAIRDVRVIDVSVLRRFLAGEEARGLAKTSLAREVASVNADLVVNVLDLAAVAQSFGSAGSPNYLVNMDTNKDGAVNVIDLSFVAQRFGPCP